MLFVLVFCGNFADELLGDAESGSIVVVVAAAAAHLLSDEQEDNSQFMVNSGFGGRVEFFAIAVVV